MGKDFRAKLRRGIADESLGVLQDVLVRPCPDHPGEDWEIVDGQHRYEVLRDLGVADVDAKVAELDDDSARMAGVILNELRGAPDVSVLQKLVQSLAGTAGLDRMAELFPWRDDVLRRLAQDEAVFGGTTFDRPDKRYVDRIPVVAMVSQEAYAALGELMRIWRLQDVGEGVSRAIMETYGRRPREAKERPARRIHDR